MCLNVEGVLSTHIIGDSPKNPPTSIYSPICPVTFVLLIHKNIVLITRKKSVD